MPTRKKSLIVKISGIITIVLWASSLAAASFIAGYSLAFSKSADLYAQTSVLKAKAVELEDQILRLRNYAALIDALCAQGQAATELAKLPKPESKHDSRPNNKALEAPSDDGALAD